MGQIQQYCKLGVGGWGGGVVVFKESTSMGFT